MDVREVFGTDQPVVGMVHLDPLPGAPLSDGDVASIRDAAIRDARALAEGGADAVLVENIGDVPFYADDVPKHVVASMAAVVADVRRTVDLPVGVNVLRNDTEAAIAVAVATGAEFVRVDVHTGVRVTDQGVVEGNAQETTRYRERLDADVKLLADRRVKHSAPLADEAFVPETFAHGRERGLADAVVVTGDQTGVAVDPEAVETVAEHPHRGTTDAPVFVGSGVTPENVGDLLAVADGVIVGTALKQDGETLGPVDPDAVSTLVAAARG